MESHKALVLLELQNKHIELEGTNTKLQIKSKATELRHTIKSSSWEGKFQFMNKASNKILLDQNAKYNTIKCCE